MVGIDERTLYCRYCGAELSRDGVSVLELCRANRLAHDTLCRVRGCGAVAFLGSILFGWAFIKLMVGPLTNHVALLAVASVPFLTALYERRYVRPAHPDVFANPDFRYGIPGKLPRLHLGGTRTARQE